MNNLQDLFKKAEDNIQERLDGLPVFGSYKEILKQMLNIDEQVFEMLYYEDTINSQDYDLESVDLTAAFERLEQFQ